MTRSGMSRRRFLRGVGGALALPLLGDFGALGPAWADGGASGFPTRLLFVYSPNGKHMPDWTPEATGSDFEFPFLLEPLTPFRDRVRVLSGLTLDGARANGDGPGDHARATAAFLTAAHPFKTGGADIRTGVSVDQVAAARLGKETLLPSLELGCEPNQMAGECDSGYSCIYSSNVSWRSASTPATKETHPRRAFERLFADPEGRLPPEERARRARARGSVLDFALAGAKDLQGDLGPTDRRKVDEYLTALRETEVRIEKVRAERQTVAQGFETPKGIPADFQEYVRLMYDLAVLAFRSDTTRVATILLGNAGSNRSYPFIGVSEGHHHLSHHGGDRDKQMAIRKINRFHTEQLAYLVGRLAAVPEGDGTLLDHTLVVYGSGIADGDAHAHDDLPIVVVGGPSGKPVHLRSPAETPLANLWLSLLGKVGVSVPRFADSTGPLAGLTL